MPPKQNQHLNLHRFVGCCAGVAFSARSVLSVADIIYDPLIFDLINEPVIIVTIVLTQPLDRLVFRVRISQFDLANGRRAALEMPVWITIWRTFICHTGNGHSIRSLARYYVVHPSTVLRSVCKIEIERTTHLSIVRFKSCVNIALNPCLGARRIDL